MKHGVIQKIASVFMFCVICTSVPFAASAQPKPPEYKIGQKFQADGLNLSQNTYLIDVQQGDVTGDSAKDYVLLVGQKDNPTDTRYSQLNVVVRDGKTGKFSMITDKQIIGYLSGFEPKMFLGDFTGDKISDVMVTVATGGSGGVYDHLIVNWKNNNPIIIFGEKQNEGLIIRGNFLDDFKAKLTVEGLNKTFIVDVSWNKKNYIDSKVYNANGKYIYKDPDNTSGYNIYSDPFSLLYPSDVNNDGVYELQGSQYVWGPFHVFGVTDVDSVWKYSGVKWIPIDATYTARYRILGE